VAPEVITAAQTTPVQDPAPSEQTIAAAEACESCSTIAELFDVPHHQASNPKSWRYCVRCKSVHENEIRVVAALQELAKTHPGQANTPDVSRMLHAGMSVEAVKAELDRTRQPELEAEIVA